MARAIASSLFSNWNFLVNDSDCRLRDNASESIRGPSHLISIVGGTTTSTINFFNTEFTKTKQRGNRTREIGMCMIGTRFIWLDIVVDPPVTNLFIPDIPRIESLTTKGLFIDSSLARYQKFFLMQASRAHDQSTDEFDCKTRTTV